jgi:hypothetical protein
MGLSDKIKSYMINKYHLAAQKRPSSRHRRRDPEKGTVQPVQSKPLLQLKEKGEEKKSPYKIPIQPMLALFPEGTVPEGLRASNTAG